MARADEPTRGAPLRPYDGPTRGRRVRVLAASEALTDPICFTGIVVATRLGAFQLQGEGLPPAWFKTSDRWFYAEALFPKDKATAGDRERSRNSR